MLGGISIFFPQAIRGDELNTTSILVQNPEDLPAAVGVRFFDQKGQEQENQQTALQPNGSDRIVLGGPGVPLTAGWAVVVADHEVFATGVYSLQLDSIPLPPVGILPVAGAAKWRGFGTVSAEEDTGLAVANPGTGTANCQLTAYMGSEGQMVGLANLSLDSDEQMAEFLPALIETLPFPYEGAVALDCDQEVVTVALSQRISDGAVTAVALIAVGP